MAALLSAIGLFISTLTSVSEHAKTLTRAKKRRLGKFLAGTVELLDTVLARADAILRFVSQMPTASGAERGQVASDTATLIEEQVKDLAPLLRLFGRELESICEGRDVSTTHGRKPPTSLRLARRILRIYEPVLGDRLDGVLDQKKGFLRELDTILKHEFGGLAEPEAVIREIGGIDHRSADTTAPAGLQLTESKEIDISDKEAVGAYVGRARNRLQELSAARQSLANLVREQFSVEDLL